MTGSLIFAFPDPDTGEGPGEGVGEWWSATRIVRLDRPLVQALVEATESTTPGLTGFVTIHGTAIYDIDPLASGLDELRWIHPTNQVPVEVPVDQVCREAPVVSGGSVDDGDLEDAPDAGWQSAFRVARDTFRIDHGLPRHVVRSDVFNARTRQRAPLYALRHPWPPGVFFQGGSASRHFEVTDGNRADVEQIEGIEFIERRDGTTMAWVRDQVFIEAFPQPTPDNTSGGFMRGQGATFAEAEDGLWAKWTAKQTCAALASTGTHAWETRGYKNGAGFCAECGVFGSGVFDVAEVGEPCVVCGVRCWYDHVGEVGGEPGQGAFADQRSRSRQSRTVCENCHPPVEWRIAPILGEIVNPIPTRPDRTRDISPAALQALFDAVGLDSIQSAWIDRHLPAIARVGSLAEAFAAGIRYDLISDAILDGRAWLVDEMIAGRIDPQAMSSMRQVWHRLEAVASDQAGASA